ncbi:MAG: methyltransferase domain-containing protein [Ignavibacteria bacterium]|nr:methyltransferase domain-containing protein [Ignavibacteria bacterium]
MNRFSKVCDGADWFLPGVSQIIAAELREPARFHRKQWEFAMIFRALSKLGVFGSQAVGLSMGGGRERLLYSIVHHVRQLVVTDLYDTETPWSCARTDNPEDFIKSDPPFPAPLSRMTVLGADMRDLPFPSETFDFCYSTCAIEHIGGRGDFLRHLNEVHRVLRNGGVYVFSTEFHYGPETIADPDNVIFSWDYLKDLLSSAPLVPEPVFDARLTRHTVNYPLPGNIRELSFAPGQFAYEALHDFLPHLQLLRGKYPFTAGLFVLKKNPALGGRPVPDIMGLEDSLGFLRHGVGEYRKSLRKGRVTVSPFSSLPGGIPPHFSDHAEFFTPAGVPDRTVFHTDYIWWGEGARTFRISVEPLEGTAAVNARIHAYRTLDSEKVSCISERTVRCAGPTTIEFEINVKDDYCYALVGKAAEGECRLKHVSIESASEGATEVRTDPPVLSASRELKAES